MPPDIRRERDVGALGSRVVEHYSTCGRSAAAAACFQWDFSIDPRSREAFDANVAAVIASKGDVQAAVAALTR